jgi:hypothetical protein
VLKGNPGDSEAIGSRQDSPRWSMTAPALRYWRICSTCSSVASQWTSWQPACRRIDDPPMSASAIRATGNSVSWARAHRGQVTGNRTPGSFHAPSFPLSLFNSGTGGDDSECHSKGSNACALPMPCETSWHLPEARGHSPKATGSVHKLRINRPYFINVGYRRHAMIASTAHARGICNQARRPGMRRRAAPKGSPGGIQGLPVRSSM